MQQTGAGGVKGVRQLRLLTFWNLAIYICAVAHAAR
jgi:hypothetical protein